MACTCEKTKVGKGTGGVVGHIVASLCTECQSRQETDRAEMIKRKAEMDKEILISNEVRKLGESSLKAAGKIV